MIKLVSSYIIWLKIAEPTDVMRTACISHYKSQYHNRDTEEVARLNCTFKNKGNNDHDNSCSVPGTTLRVVDALPYSTTFWSRRYCFSDLAEDEIKDSERLGIFSKLTQPGAQFQIQAV